MKILGHVRNEYRLTGYIIEMSTEELANLIGQKYPDNQNSLHVGTVIYIHKMYERIQELLTFPEKLKEMQKYLRVAVDWLDLDPIIESIIGKTKEGKHK
jgi:hypothetical protein